MTNEQTPVITIESARQAAEDYRQAELDLQRIESTIKSRVAAINAEYEETIAELTLKQNDSRDLLAAYADAKRDELLAGDKKSASFYGLTIGWKTSPPRLTLRRAKDTWDKVMVRLKEGGYSSFITTKEYVNKNELKKADTSVLSSVGVQLEQEDHFFVKL